MNQNNSQQNPKVGALPSWIVILIVCFSMITLYNLTKVETTKKIEFSTLMNAIENNQVQTVKFDTRLQRIAGTYKADPENPQKILTFESNGDLNQNSYVDALKKKGITIDYVEITEPSILVNLFFTFLPLFFLVGFFWWTSKKNKNGMGMMDAFSKTKAKLIPKNSNNITFDSIAGINEAKEDLEEIVDYLKNPQKYQRLGAKIPRGAILVGPPGTGKTMLAKAVAQKADAAFLSLSGSDFVQMFVGVGAQRVRDTFEQAKKLSPCIIFIDEIDAIGKQRGGASVGGNDEREQTLNQLLVEMDGFDTASNVIVLAATNRKDVLDPALLRPGRFDRTVHVSLPDIKGREQILRVHAKEKIMAPDVDFFQIAKGTARMSGADLANLVNEAAMIAAKNDAENITLSHLEAAKDKIQMGSERKTLVMSELEKATTAWHEAGHTLISYFTEGLDQVHKVSIIPRGMALGVTQTTSEEDQLSLSKKKAINMIAMLMGGRAAEELQYSHFTTGASNDIERASMIARRMVCEWGMSESLGPINFNKDHNGFITSYDYSEKTKEKIDSEVTRLIEEGLAYAKKLLKDKYKELEIIALALIDKETLDASDLKKLLQPISPETSALVSKNLDIIA